MKTNQYFIYGTLISYSTFVELNSKKTVDDVLSMDDDIQGIFNNRDGNFIIIGRILKNIKNNNEPQIVPELHDIEISRIKYLVKNRYNVDGEFNYYFVKK